MKERIVRSSQELLGKGIIETITPAMHEAYIERGCVGIAQKTFDILHARPEYLRASDPDFDRSRKRLNSEPGLIISNHPGPGDCPSVLNALDRRDLKFLVAEEAIEQEKLSSIIPKDMILGATKDMGKLRPVIKALIEHIRSGGAVFYFPTGMEKAQGKTAFASLFGALLREIPVESMVYAFKIDAGDLQKVASKGKFAARSSADFILPDFIKPITKLGEPSVIHVDEKYTQSRDWLENFKQSGRPKTELNNVMTEYYEGLFE
jgi:hypothetical protein